MEKMSPKEIKEKIMYELGNSKDPVYPGTIAVKYGVPYNDVIESVEELQEEGKLEK